MAVTIELVLEEYGVELSALALNASPILALDMPLSTPEMSMAQAERIGDGDVQSPSTWRSTTESINLLITGANAGAVKENVNAIEAYLYAARDARDGFSPRRVFLRVQFDHDTTKWRSQIISGQLVMVRGTDQIWRKHVEAALILTRRYFWEDNTERSIALTSRATTTATTGGVTIHNTSGAGSTGNWFKATSGQISGTIPAPVKITIRNASGDDRYAQSVYLGNYALLGDPEVDVALEATSGTWASSKNLVAGAETAYTWSTPLPTALLTAAGRRYMRALVVWGTEPTVDTLIRGKTQFDDGGYLDVVVGEQLRANGAVLLDLGAFPLLAGGLPQLPSTGMRFSITTEAVSDQTVTLDWLMLFPAGPGTFRRLRALDLSTRLYESETLVDDGIDGNVYVINAAGTGTDPWFRGYGSPLHVFPGRTQLFRMLIQGQTAMQTGTQYTARAYYRPRRLTF
jgi:hypothetical protein